MLLKMLFFSPRMQILSFSEVSCRKPPDSPYMSEAFKEEDGLGKEDTDLVFDLWCDTN